MHVILYLIGIADLCLSITMLLHDNFIAAGAAALSGVLLIGFGYVIELLRQIRDNTERVDNTPGPR